MRTRIEWTEEINEFIRKHHTTMTAQEMAEHLGNGIRNTHILDRMYRHLGLHAIQPVRKGRKQYKPWTPEEIEFVRRNIGILTNREIAEKLGRTKTSVADKQYRLFGCGRPHGQRRQGSDRWDTG